MTKLPTCREEGNLREVLTLHLSQAVKSNKKRTVIIGIIINYYIPIFQFQAL